jgi:hypothetical protein
MGGFEAYMYILRVGLATANRLSASMLLSRGNFSHSNYNTFSSTSLPFDNIRSFIRNSIHRSLQMRRRDHRQDTSIHDPQLPHAIDPLSRIVCEEHEKLS